VKAIKNRKTQR